MQYLGLDSSHKPSTLGSKGKLLAGAYLLGWLDCPFAPDELCCVVGTGMRRFVEEGTKDAKEGERNTKSHSTNKLTFFKNENYISSVVVDSYPKASCRGFHPFKWLLAGGLFRKRVEHVSKPLIIVLSIWFLFALPENDVFEIGW